MLKKIDPKYRPWIIGSLIMLLLLAAWYFGYYMPKQRALEDAKNADPNKSLNNDVGLEGNGLFANCPNDSFPLRYGSCGSNVERMQKWLLKRHGEFVIGETSEFGPDGKWGDETQNIVQKIFKRDNVSEGFFLDRNMQNLEPTIWA